jgi:hypothetical protein
MGSWNPTCGISNLPILHNEDVVMLLLGHGRNHPRSWEQFPTLGGYHGMSRGPTALYQPLLWPIYGEHNDYRNI